MGPDVMDNQASSSPDEEEMSDEDDRLEERRRRFCMERRQELVPNDSAAKPIRYIKSIRPSHRPNRDMKRPRSDSYINSANSNKRRRAVGFTHQNPYPQPHHHLQQTEQAHNHRASNLTVVKVSEELPPQGPVIFINPSFVKKFLEKYIKLASNTATNTNTSTTFYRRTQTSTNHLFDSNKASTGTAASTNPAQSSSAAPNTTTTMIEVVDSFKTCPIGSLQAACTMTIIRLVTECIEDDNKRDERYNKRMVAQLLEKLKSNP